MTKQNPKSMPEAAKSGNSLLMQVGKKIKSALPLFRKSYTYISEEVTFVGDLAAKQDIVLDGKMQGNIRAKGHVSLGSTALFEGTIECESASISGKVIGRVHTTKTITVRVPATITGDLVSASVEVESGVLLNGKIISKPQDKQTEPLTESREPTFSPFAEAVEGR